MITCNDDNKKDLARNIIIASANVVPIVGGVLSFFLDKYLPSAIESRRNKFFEKIENDLQLIPNEVIEQICNDPDYTSIVLKVFRNALEDERSEKVNAYRNILINATVNRSIGFNEQSFYVKLIADLTVDQIRVLHLFYLRDNKGVTIFGSTNNINDYIRDNWPEVDESYRFALLTEILRYGLVTGSQNSQREHGEGHHLSPFGERFVQYIFSPNAIRDTVEV